MKKKTLPILISILIVVSIFGTIGIISAADTGWHSPGTIFNDDVIGNRPWMYIDDAKTSNDEYARRAGLAAGGTSWILKSTNFNMGVPSGATIDGIYVQIERDALGYPGVWDNLVRLVDHTGNYVGDNKAKSAAWSKTEGLFSYGSSTNKWGETWTRAIINDVDFGVGLSVILDPADGGDPHTALVDHIRIKVYYTEPTPSNFYINIGDTWQDAEQIYINIGDVWQDVEYVAVNVGDVWQQIFSI